MKIGDEVFVHGYVDEIRNDVIIIRNDGGYFGTVPSEVFCYEEDKNGYGTMNTADTPQTEVRYCNECKWFRDKQVCGRCRSLNLFAKADTPQTEQTEPSGYKMKPLEQTESRDLAQDLATGKESILSIAIKGKMERRGKQTDCPWK